MTWYKDGIYKCNKCGSIFNVDFKEDDGWTVDFCPACGTTDIEYLNEQ